MGAKEAKRRPCTEEEQKIVNDNVRLVYTVAKKFRRRANAIGFGTYEDIVSEGFVGLVIAAQKFDPSYGFTFSTFAVPQIEGYIKRYFRDKGATIRVPRSMMEKYNKKEIESPFKKMVSFSYIVVENDHEDRHLDIESALGGEEDFSFIEAEEFILNLPKKHRTVMMLAYEGKTQRDIGKFIGVSQAEVSRILKRIRQLFIDYSSQTSREEVACQKS